MKKALRRVTMRVRAWIRTNITGDASNGYVLDPAPAKPTFDERLESAMEVAEVMPPPLLTEKDLLNPEGVKFWVNKLVEWVGDLVVSGIVAVFAWVYFRSTTGKGIPEGDGHHDEQIKILLPVAVWVVCFVILAGRRLLARARREKLTSGKTH